MLLMIYLSSGAYLNMLIHEETRPTNFKQIAQDRSGNIYIAGCNVLYKLMDGLHLIHRFPMDQPNCSKMENVILELFPGENYLLFCGSVKQSLCSVYPTRNLAIEYQLDGTNYLNYLGN